MAGPRPVICERATICGNESPHVPIFAQRELEYAKCAGLEHLTVFSRLRSLVQRCTAGSDRELPYSKGRVQFACRILRCKTLVEMIVSREDDLGSGIVENRPDRLHGQCIAVWP